MGLTGRVLAMKVFGVSFLAFSVVFLLVYFFSVYGGGPSVGDEGLPLWKIFSGFFIVVFSFSFWMTMLVDCLSSGKVDNRIFWGVGLFLFSWLAAILYFFAVYRKR
ncbi:hypothetical protein [Microbulbifer halophilus]